MMWHFKRTTMFYVHAEVKGFFFIIIRLDINQEFNFIVSILYDETLFIKHWVELFKL